MLTKISPDKSVLLASYSWGAPARRQTAMPNDMLIDECLRVVAKAMSISVFGFSL